MKIFVSISSHGNDIESKDEQKNLKEQVQTINTITESQLTLNSYKFALKIFKYYSESNKGFYTL